MTFFDQIVQFLDEQPLTDEEINASNDVINPGFREYLSDASLPDSLRVLYASAILQSGQFRGNLFLYLENHRKKLVSAV